MLHFIKLKLRQWVVKKLKLTLIGVDTEAEAPPEFIITNHALERLKRRIKGRSDYKELVLEAWHYGKEPPPDFIIDAATRPPYFRMFRYCYYDYNVYVFGLKRGKRVHNTQKFLITIFNWH